MVWTTCSIKCFSEWCTCTILWPSKIPWCMDKCLDDDIQRQVKSHYCAANKLRGTFKQCSPAVKNTLFRRYYMWILCLPGANTHRLVWNTYVLCIIVPTELLYALHAQKYKCSPIPAQLLCQDLLPCLKKIDIDILYAVHLHPTFLSDCFKCLLLFTNLHTSSIVQCF